MSDVTVSAELNFDDLQPIEEPVLIAGGKYVLREASGGGANAYQNAQMSVMEFGDSGKCKRVTGLADSEPLLVSRCLFKADVDEEGHFQFNNDGSFKRGASVKVGTIESWPHRIQKALHKRAKEISDLQVEEDTKESLGEEQADLARRLKAIEEKAAKNDDSPPQTMHG